MISLSTGSLHSYGLARVFELAAQVGFEGIEVIIDHRLDCRDPAYLRRLSAACRLPIVALHSPFLADVPGWPADQLERLRRSVALAQDLGVPVVVTHLPYHLYGVFLQGFGLPPGRFFLPFPWPRREAYYRALAEGQLADMEAESGVIVAVENMPRRQFLGWTLPLYWYNRVEELARFRHLTLDTTHLGTWGLDPVQVYERLRGRVRHVHLSNYDGREHRPPPQGSLRLDALLRALSRDGYRGAVSVECGPEAFEAEDEGRCRVALARTLDYCRQHYLPGDGGLPGAEGEG